MSHCEKFLVGSIEMSKSALELKSIDFKSSALKIQSP
jgi:hypothetical protein